MVTVTCGKCGADVSGEIIDACSVMSELDKRFGTTTYSDCIAKVLLADFISTYASETKDHILLCRDCDSEGKLKKLCEGKIFDLDEIRKYRE